MTNLDHWNSKKVFITGGTSGLGKALAIQLDELGATVAILARTDAGIQEMITSHPHLIGIQGDVSDKEQIYTIAGEVHEKLGDVDILFNVVSYLGATPLRLLVDTDCEDFEKVLQTNLLGLFRLSKALLPTMLTRQSGTIVNISSDAAINPYPTWGSYGVSKAAVDHLSRIFHEELNAQGVGFLSIDPGDMNTPMHFAAVPEADPKTLRDPHDSATRILQLVARQDFSEVRRSL